MNVRAGSIAGSVSAVGVALMTILSEESQAFKSFLTGLTGHHWVSKSIITLVLFFGIYAISARTKDNEGFWKETLAFAIITIISALAIFGFYLFVE
ncbi:hypothetical protein D6817_00165 [Candidatus Pacearchaeota archaeon]|nr:MAG: hypothetical protein D6817_00165 [Candidatus Pacearchaeota archaeon]